MFIAKQKRKENIAEYIIYLYQVEDLIRAFKLDMDSIRENLLTAYNADDETSEDILRWYKNLVVMMEKEGKKEKGHLQFIVNMLSDLNEFHLRLLETGADKMYTRIFAAVAGLISELKQKNPDSDDDVPVAIDGIYGYIMLKIQKKEITQETENAVKRISQWLSYLSRLYKNYEKGEFEL